MSNILRAYGLAVLATMTSAAVTLRKFIEAMNGELVIAARFADGVEVPITLSDTEDAA